MRYFFYAVALLLPGVVSAHTGDDIHNVLGVFGHPVAVVLLLVALLGISTAVRKSIKKRKVEDVSI